MSETLAIHTLRLIAFRSYARLDLAPDASAIALAGPNGAGKTNILEAISLLSPGRGLRRATPADLPRRQAGIGWSVKADLTTPEGDVALWTGAEADGRRIARRDGDPASVVSLGRVARVLWLTPALDRVFVEGPGERRRFIDRAAMSFFPEHAEISVRYEKAMRERNRLLKDGVNDPRWLSALEARLVDDGLAVGEARRGALAALMAAQDAASAFPRAEALLEGDFEAALEAEAPEEVYARALHDGRRVDAQAGRTLYGPHRSDLAVRFAAKDQPAAECSTGEQKALLVSLALANARAIATRTGAPPVLLLDEIAAHFDSERRAALFAEIKTLGAQSWMTGTEWPLFEALPGCAARYDVQEGAEGSILMQR